MTSKLTRERLLEIAEDGFLKHGESKVLARMALAGMDSEPVAIVEPSDYVTAAQLVGEGPARKAVHELYEGALRIGDKLYRHAQPVVPDGLVKAVEFYEQVKRENPPVETGAWKDAVDWVLKEACRAAMLNGGKP
ncbi:hypothetical protein [Klebsiella pneumoniae]|uniref:hypothetical protein n=1 Tax=Klebsiella pneumoniae TaxID=573 RepID=UPI002041F916|nr:hypothetical protein [Klebsiella pneumoniae]USB65888.1 hypothetical protein KU669_03220 [Klebsiella pneumoniae]